MQRPMETWSKTDVDVNFAACERFDLGGDWPVLGYLERQSLDAVLSQADIVLRATPLL